MQPIERMKSQIEVNGVETLTLSYLVVYLVGILTDIF